MNLLDETIRVLKDHGHNSGEVDWIGDHEYFMNWDNFKKLADREYNDRYGNEEVNLQLIVVGKNWWLERHQYDGSEWWEYKEYPKIKRRIFNPNMDIWEKYDD